MYGSGMELPKVAFSLIDYSEIRADSYFIGFDLDNDGKLSKMDSTGAITPIEGAASSPFDYEIGEWVPSEGGVIAHRWLDENSAQNYLVVDTQDLVKPGCDTIYVTYTVNIPGEFEAGQIFTTTDSVQKDGTANGKNTYSWNYANENFVIQWTGSYWALVCTTNGFDYENAIAALNTSSDCPFGEYTLLNPEPNPMLSGITFNAFSITSFDVLEWIMSNAGFIGATSRWNGDLNSAIIRDAAMQEEIMFETPAVTACKESTNGGKLDWYLPSVYELGKVAQNAWEIAQGFEEAGGAELSIAIYWTSSEVDTGSVFVYNFIDGAYGQFEKGGGFGGPIVWNPNVARVRAMRKFSLA